MLRALIALSMTCCLATSGIAATLEVANGDVLVSRGEGFKRGVAGQKLQAGDRVMIGKSGGEATISYEDQCVERVRFNERNGNSRVAVVGRLSPCAMGAQTVPALPSATGIMTGVAAAGIVTGTVVILTKPGQQASP